VVWCATGCSECLISGLRLFRFARPCTSGRGFAPTLTPLARNLKCNKRHGAASHDNFIVFDPQLLTEVMYTLEKQVGGRACQH